MKENRSKVRAFCCHLANLNELVVIHHFRETLDLVLIYTVLTNQTTSFVFVYHTNCIVYTGFNCGLHVMYSKQQNKQTPPKHRNSSYEKTKHNNVNRIIFHRCDFLFGM